ncbi:MAG TPA: ACP S-malonyltransferase [Chloroflexi bacterium]|nr:ACP S-malonyltransferase [Chloroflexota bacterium]
MPGILSDHNCEGQARIIFQELDRIGYSALLDLHLLVFADVGLDVDANDELVWTTCQSYGYLLLTGNRNTSDGDESLEVTMRRLAHDHVIPVLTISDLRRVQQDRDYAQRCATTLAEVVLNLDLFRGVLRLYLP